MPKALVTVFLRNRGQVLLRETEQGSTPIDRPLTETVETSGRAVARNILDDPGRVTVTRSGAPLKTGITRHPVLLDVSEGRLAREHSNGDLGWAHPTVLLREGGSPDNWRAYRAVAETVETVRSNTDHGASTLSVRALEVLRDRSAELAQNGEFSRQPITETAEALATSRPELSVLTTRIDRAMSRANGRVSELESICRDEIERATRGDREAAEAAAGHCQDATVLSLSRSGTVEQTLLLGEPDSIILLESRPAREAIPMGESLANADLDITITLDAAIGEAIQTVDRVVVGADTITADGSLFNKIGTYPVAVLAHAHEVPVVVVSSIDKIRPASTVPRGNVSPVDIYDGDAPVTASSPLLDRTDAKYLDHIVSERGPLSIQEIERIAVQHREYMSWRTT